MKRKLICIIALLIIILMQPRTNIIVFADESSTEADNPDNPDPDNPDKPNPDNPDPDKPKVPIEKITLKKTEVKDLKLGDTYKLEVEVFPENADKSKVKFRIVEEKSLKDDVSKTVLSVDEEKGVVTVKGLGEATVEAYYEKEEKPDTGDEEKKEENQGNEGTENKGTEEDKENESKEMENKEGEDTEGGDKDNKDKEDGDKEDKIAAQCSFIVYQTYFDVSKLGADGSDDIADTESMKTALKWATAIDETITVYVPEGVYYIDDVLYIYSNTKLLLDEKAIVRRKDGQEAFVMLRSMYEKEATGGYSQCINVEITGGIWDGNASMHPHIANIFIGHASNINIHDTKIINNGGCHLLEYAGVRNSVIEKVILSGFLVCNRPECTVSQQVLKEAVQLDYCTKESAKTMIPNDKTSCENIVIRGCVISNYMCGIGQHGTHSGVTVDNIIIENNTFSNITNCCIDIRNYRNVIINNNKAVGYNVFLYSLNSTGVVRKNTLDNMAFSPIVAASRMTPDCIYSKNSRLVIDGNSITKCGNNGINVTGKSIATIQNNVIQNNSNYGIRVSDSTAIIDGNKVSDNGQKKQFYASSSSKLLCDDIRIFNVTYKDTYYHTGKKIKPDVKIKGLEINKDFKVTYKNNKKVGTGKIIIKGKGKYKGTKELTFKIKKKKKKKKDKKATT